jgi:hypothetical protein
MIKEGAPKPPRFDLPIDTCPPDQHNDVLQKMNSTERKGDEKLEMLDGIFSAAKFNSYVRTWNVLHS